MTLVEFLTARLDELKAKAIRARDGERTAFVEADDDIAPLLYTNGSFDLPARVLREVEAKRRIIELHSAKDGQHPEFCWHDKHELPCPTLRIEASTYPDHPDYREEWRP